MVTPTPRGAYRFLRDQLGSVRGVYLSKDGVVRRERFEADELVLLLHGFFQTRNIWEVMEDRLRYDGYGVISFNLTGAVTRLNTRPIEHVATLVAEKVERLCEREGVRRLHVVGHSKGGLVARRWIQHHGGDRRVKSLVTLGTPHHGTPTAFVGVAISGLGLVRTSAHDLVPGSQVVNALARDVFPGQIPLTSIYSKADLVCPYWASVLSPRDGESSMRNVEVPGVGHSELTWSPAVYHEVKAALDGASRVWRERSGRAAE